MMITISVCMIVKDEEQTIRRCLESLEGVYDELIVVDTGSTDDTKRIAKDCGAQVYDYVWQQDFADARNFAFSKANCEYIYSADADETLDEENRQRFLILKEHLNPDIDIVQMWYRNQLKYETVYNYDKELRPKLFKRMRPFIWEGAVHEQVRMNPIVFDADVEIDHHPATSHASRDLEYFRRSVERGGLLDARLHDMYARELTKAGTEEDFALARPYFAEAAEDANRSMDEVKQSFYILARTARMAGDKETFFKYALRDVACEATSEMCFELGCFFRDAGDLREAKLWFFNAHYEQQPLLDLHRAGDLALQELVACCSALGDTEELIAARQALDAWIEAHAPVH